MKKNQPVSILGAFLLLFLLGSFIGPLGCRRQTQPTVLSDAQYQDAKKAANGLEGPISPGAKKLYEQAMDLYRTGEFDQAANLLGQAAQLGRGAPTLRSNALVYQADALRNADRCPDAIPAARQAIAEFPERWEAYLVLADCYLHHDEDEKARRVLVDCLKVAPELPEAAIGLAKVERRLGDMLGALEHTRLAYRLSGKEEHRRLLSESYLALGRQKEKDNDHAGAATAYSVARELNPADPLPAILLGRIVLHWDHLGEARKLVAAGREVLQVPARIPDEAFLPTQAVPANCDIDEFVHMAEFYQARDQYLEAAQQLEYALSFEPRRPELWWQLGMLRAEHLSDPLGGKECLHALWLLDGESERIQRLAMALNLTAAEPPEANPGFTIQAGVGMEYDPAAQTVKQAEGALPCGRRIYFCLRLGKAGGEHRVQWQIRGPDGKLLEDLEWSMTFFGRDFSLLESGLWYNPGMYEVIWLMDGAVRSRQSFELRNP